MQSSKNSNNNTQNNNWEIYSIPLLLLFLVVTGNFIGQLLPCKLQNSLTKNMYLKHLVAFLILLFVIEIGERKYNKFSELFLNTLIVYIIFLFAIRLSLGFFIGFIFVIASIYSLYLYSGKQDDPLIKANVSKITRILYYIAIFILIVGVLQTYNKKRQKYGNNFSILNFFFGSECELKHKHTT
jgi:hypothetical protein